ncbi:hypothetical protein IBE33_09330 [Francisella philomiragia]|uniref:hypothetical protein n=1 Tax=Francisella philomiragia TaxID=28110 RepID=UPI00190855FB|nr:hypothetical protein [Francisella philomiragia]MBK2341711.1 hypothetical protein [Francisella philomiragia]
MSINKLIELENKKEKIEKRISRLKNRVSLENSQKRAKEDAYKKRLAATFLLSDIFSLVKRVSFSRYEMFTIAGLIIMNDLNKYTSDILMASYNFEIQKCIRSKDYENELLLLGKDQYLVDRKISKDINEILQLINGIMIKCKRLIENSNLEDLRTKGQIQFVKIKEKQRQKKIELILNQLKK